ncbi:lipid A export permease/ATP-binding protein MsbA [Nevskia sp.]|uniref:lipid A export permease/ATP-binding protein MsbA n=1 Tax=Nevskia sp. TaxID=1929292 RepID=UPI0025D397CA|nr:lipid A export permease/ATP-binding protein MsbA [Nevskia sp.]
MSAPAANRDPYRPSAVWRRLLRYGAPHWRLFLLAVIGMVTFAATDITFVRLIKPLIDSIFVERDPKVIAIMPFAILGIFLLRGLAGFSAAYGIAAVGQRVVSRLRCEVFEHLLLVPVTHHDKARNADLQTQLTYHAGQVADSATGVLTSIIKDGLSALGLLGLMFWTSWKLALFTLIIAPLVSGSITWVNRRFRKLSARVQNSVSGITHSADEAITGRRILKLYGGEKVVLDAFRRMDDYLRRQSLKMTASGAASNSALEVIAAIGVAMLVYVATAPGMIETVSAGTFASFIAAMLSLRAPMASMTGISERLQRGLVAGADLFRFLDTPVEQDSGTRALARANGALRFDDVRFAYDADGRDALAGVTLDVTPGSTVAFVGRSGSGKSTLLSLIPRFYEPRAGRVLLDGFDARDYRLSDLRRQIALVDQNIVLFNATIADNIAYGSENVSRERIEQAARRAHAWEFIAALPQGLDTVLGQDGANLSGGQKQRLTIARALYKDAPILILDEATSALDTESERAIQQALTELMRGRTTLVIAHRLSTIQSADCIVVMDQGRIVEQGTHAELIARDGAYAALHRLQFRDEPVAA